MLNIIKKNKTTNYKDKVNNLAKKIKNADAIVIGIGAGMSASGGISYTDSNLVKEWFPEYYHLGFRSIIEIQSVFWNLKDENVLAYWGYWARHIENIRYKSELTAPYKNLAKIMEDKNYFIVTTNADGQTQKAGFDNNKIFAPQGNYDVFQCATPCRWDEIYFNDEMIKNMVASIKENNQIDKELIPKCPHCGNYLIPNIRCDYKFVEKPHMYNIEDYKNFISANSDKNIIFLELGVGYNTPGIIRYPFEQMTDSFSNATLVRINKGMTNVLNKIENKSICIDQDINKVLLDVIKAMK